MSALIGIGCGTRRSQRGTRFRNAGAGEKSALIGEAEQAQLTRNQDCGLAPVNGSRTAPKQRRDELSREKQNTRQPRWRLRKGPRHLVQDLIVRFNAGMASRSRRNSSAKHENA